MPPIRLAGLAACIILLTYQVVFLWHLLLQQLLLRLLQMGAQGCIKRLVFFNVPARPRLQHDLNWLLVKHINFSHIVLESCDSTFQLFYLFCFV